MIALALASIIASATLSISSPSEYFNTNPIETNRLSNVGMGDDPPTNYPVMYNDNAFLSEAFCERLRFFSSTNSYTPKDDISVLLNPEFAITYRDIVGMSHGGGQIVLRGFVADEMTNSIIISITKSDRQTPGQAIDYNKFWLDVFDSEDPFFHGSISNIIDRTSPGKPISREDFALLYGDCKVMYRPAFYEQYTANTSTRIDYEIKNYSSYIVGYHVYDDGEFVYGNDWSTNRTDTVTGFTFSVQRTLTAGKKKYVGWKYRTDEHGHSSYVRQTGITKSGYTELEYKNNIPNGSAWCKGLYHCFSTNQVVKKVTAFACGDFKHEYTEGSAVVANEEGWFLAPVSAEMNGDKIIVQLGGPKQQELIEGVFECFDAEYLADDSALLNKIAEDFEDPSLIDHADCETNSEVHEDYYRISLYYIYVVLEMDFNSRVIDE